MIAVILVVCITGLSPIVEAERIFPPFEVTQSFTITGTSDFPIYAVGRYSSALRVVPADDGFLALNSNADRLVLVSPDGRDLRFIGGEGSGPGEFMSPTDAVRLRGDWLVLEAGNPRVQRLNDSGIVQETFPYTAGSALTQLLQRNDRSLWLAGWQGCEEAGICLLSTLPLENGTVRTALPVEDRPLNIAWRFAVDRMNRVYAVNTHGSVIDVINERGTHTAQIDISSDSIDPLPQRVLNVRDQRERLMRGAEAMRTEPHTFIAAIAASNDRLYVQHGLANYGEGREYVLDVFSLDGQLLAQGLKAPGRLQAAYNDQLIFVDYRDVDPLGEAEILVARYDK